MKVLIVTVRRYNPRELWVTLGVLRKADIEFEVVSTSTTITDEDGIGYYHTLNRTVYEVEDVDDFDGLMVISGNPNDTYGYWSDIPVLQIVHKLNKSNKALAAICVSVPTLRHAAKGKRVSFYPLLRSKALLESNGAILSDVVVSVDQNLCTAEHQMATQLWAECFVDLLKTGTADPGLTDSGFRPPVRERRPIPEVERLKKPEDRTKVRKPKRDS